MTPEQIAADKERLDHPGFSHKLGSWAVERLLAYIAEVERLQEAETQWETGWYSEGAANAAGYNEAAAEVERLRAALRAQAAQTQQTAQEKHDAVLAVLDRHGVIPEGLDRQGHPIEQIVGTCVAILKARDE